MKAAALVGPLTVLLLSACSASQPNHAAVPAPTDITDLISRSLAAMDALESYRMEITFSPEEDPLTAVVDFADPTDYHYVVTEPDSPGETSELIVVGDSSYVRSCEHHPHDCTEWEQHERPLVSSLGGLTTTVPETLSFVALELASDPGFVATESIDGHLLLHLRASVNLLRSIYENQRRAAVAAHIEDVEASLQEDWGDVNFEDVLPSSVDAWISTEDLVAHRVRISVPGDESDPYLEVDFSRFNEVVIEPPN